jgi:GMP synthase (glutamine-hydrolysing)
MKETILILDFGSQYTQLIARRVRELNVYCEIYPYNKIPESLSDVAGVILSGSPFSVQDNKAPIPDLSNIKGKIPLLGVCYGAQFLAQSLGGEVQPSKIREYGRANLGFIDHSCTLLNGITDNTQVWMSHGDTILEIPENEPFHGFLGLRNTVSLSAPKMQHTKVVRQKVHVFLNRRTRRT